MKSLNFILFLNVIVGGSILTDAAGLLYSTANNHFQYPTTYHSIPYALGYSYIHSPYILPYASNFKHHHPDHKENDENDSKMKEDGEKISNNLMPSPGLSEFENKDPEKNKILTETSNSNLNLEQQPYKGTYYVSSDGSDAFIPIPKFSSELKYYTFSYPVRYIVPTPLVWSSDATYSQFHHQNGLGQYYYGYSSPESSKQELKAPDGVTRGSYSYIDAEGKKQTVIYLSDENGFRVAATNLPKSPKPLEIPDSPEIVMAKNEHFKAQQEAIKRLEEAKQHMKSDSDQ